jgi:hypothetical protein
MKGKILSLLFSVSLGLALAALLGLAARTAAADGNYGVPDPTSGGLQAAQPSQPSAEEAWDVTIGNAGPSGYVETLEIAQDWLYAGGHFFSVAGVPGCGCIARWNLRSQQWENLGGGVGGGASTHVYKTLVSPDGRYVFVGGMFDVVYNDSNRQDPISTGNNANLARWDTQTRTWQVFQTTDTHLDSAWTESFALVGGQLYVGGVGQVIVDPTDPMTDTVGPARWSGDPFAETLVGEWEGLGGGLVYNAKVDYYWWVNVNILEGLPDGNLLVGGGFSQVANHVGGPPITVNRIATWDPDTSTWSGFGNGVWQEIYTADTSGAGITVGGAQGVIANCSPGGCTLLAGGLGPVDNLAYHPKINAVVNVGGILYAGGDFNRARDNSPADRLAWIEDGQWAELGGGTDNTVFALATDGRYVYVGGCFHQVGSKHSMYLARWDTLGGENTPWAIQDVAKGKYMLGSPLGTGSWLALDAAANPHISYFDGRTSDLMYASWDGSQWLTQTVDSEGSTGHIPVLALHTDGNPHISYYDSTRAEMRYAHWDGSQWISQTVESAGGVAEFGNGSLVVDSSGRPHLSYQYFDSWNAVSQLRYTWWDGTHWIVQTVEGSDHTSGLGVDSSLALDSAGHPHISYVEVEWGVGNLRYASWDGSQWVLETVDGSGHVGGSNNATGMARTSLKLDTDGNPHISYYDATDGDPKYAYKVNNDWHIETVSDSADVMGQSNSLVLDSNGNPHISFCNATKKSLMYARQTGAGWEVQTVDTDGDVGTWAILALDRGDNPHISYYYRLEPNNGVRYARLPGKILNTGTVSGPPVAAPGKPVRLEATADMPGATLPLTFTWETAAQDTVTTTATILQSAQEGPIVHIVNGLTDSMTYTWDQVGKQEVTVSMISHNGLAATAFFEITIANTRSVYLPYISR